MKDWGIDEREEIRTSNAWWRDRWNDLDPKNRLREDLLVAMGALLYLAVVFWPLYDMIFSKRPEPASLTILGGLIGLLLASYAVMSDRMYGARRALIGIFGIGFIVACWGFGPL